MKIGYVTYNGVRSDSLGIFLSGSGTFGAAELDATVYQIPGRNGDLIIPANRYKNIEVIYPAFVPNDFENRVQAVRNWMRSAEGYKCSGVHSRPAEQRREPSAGIQLQAAEVSSDRGDGADPVLRFDHFKPDSVRGETADHFQQPDIKREYILRREDADGNGIL